MAKRKKRKQRIHEGLIFEFYGIIILAIFAIGFPKDGFGVIGFSIHSFLRALAGHWDFVLSLIGIYSAIYMMVKRSFPFPWTLRKTGLLFFLLAIVLLQHVEFVRNLQLNGQYTDVNILSATWQALGQDRANGFISTEVGGGMIGAGIFTVSNYLFADEGTLIIVITLALIGFLLTFHFSYIEFFKRIKNYLSSLLKSFGERLNELYDLMTEKKKDRKAIHTVKKSAKNKDDTQFALTENTEPIIHDFQDRNNQIPEIDQKVDIKVKEDLPTTEETSEDTQDINLNGIPLKQLKEEEINYTIPPFQILNRPNIIDQGYEFRDISNNAKKLEATLESFGVKAKVTQIHRGPAVTRYEIQPDVGVKVSKIVNLSDDIALSLAAKDIRIEAPIPGKAAIGIEVPNSEIAVVTIREVLESFQYYESKSKLSIALGRDIAGEPIIGDLAKMPHILVAGATGSGKSVCINGIITSILYKAKPSEVKFLMIDPKVVELNIYNGIPHLLAPVVTNPKKASKALKMIVNEMENRYEKFAAMGARDIDRYNGLIMNEEKENISEVAPQLLPYIVVIIDELADLMMVAPNDVEDAIIRLAQKARAAGIHLLVATQRPSVDVITGLIKANVPSRIAFGVSSQIDSRTILDTGGAEKLLGRGDMLYLPVGYSKPVRVQGVYISDSEVEEVVEFVKKQQKVVYHGEIIPDLSQAAETELVEDELFDEAVNLIIESNQASVSLLQRRLRIGYTRAARLIDEMEAKGIVGPYEGSKPRRVLVGRDRENTLSS